MLTQTLAFISAQKYDVSIDFPRRDWTIIQNKELPCKIFLFSAQSLLNTPFYILHDQVRTTLEDIMEKLPDEFNMVELLGKVEERTLYQVVVLQECERMNILTKEIRESLQELNLGLKVRIDFTHQLIHHGQRLSFISCCVIPRLFRHDNNHGNGYSCAASSCYTIEQQIHAERNCELFSVLQHSS